MQIFFSGCKPSANMTFGFINIQNFSGLFCQSRINLHQAVGYVLMYRAFTDTECPGSLPDRCIAVNNVICDIHGTFFDIVFQGYPPESLFYILWMSLRGYDINYGIKESIATVLTRHSQSFSHASQTQQAAASRNFHINGAMFGWTVTINQSSRQE